VWRGATGAVPCAAADNNLTSTSYGCRTRAGKAQALPAQSWQCGPLPSSSCGYSPAVCGSRLFGLLQSSLRNKRECPALLEAGSAYVGVYQVVT
jgi:hypothetical protein